MRLPEQLGGRRRRLLVRLIANGLVQSVAAVGFAWQAQALFDVYLIERVPGAQPLWAGVAVLLLCSLLIALLRRQERIDAEIMGQTYAREVRKRLFSRLLNSQSRSRSRVRKGLVMTRFVSDLTALRQWVSLGLSRLAVAAVSLTVVLAALGWLHWGFLLLVGAGLLGTVAMMWLQGGRLRAAMQEARKRQAYLSANMAEKLGQIAVIQVSGQARAERRHLARQNRKLLRAAEGKAAALGNLRVVVELGAGIVFIGALLMTIYAVQAGQVSPGGFVAVLSLVGFLAAPMRDMGRAHEYWLAHRLAVQKLQAMAKRLRPLAKAIVQSDARIRHGAIRVAAVTVSGALDGVSFQVRAGQHAVLVGENGSGKSTLLALLARLLDADAGQVYIDDVPVDQLPAAELHRQVALVSAELPLLRGSLRDNLCYGLDDVADETVEQVIALCGMTEFVAGLPDGLQTRIEEDGGSLSQGERARIHIARALLRQPKVLLMDEADAYLDRPTSKAIDRIIEGFPGTVLIATHRRELAARAGRILHLHDGRLRAEGDAGQLLSEPGPTRDLFNPDMMLVG